MLSKTSSQRTCETRFTLSVAREIPLLSFLSVINKTVFDILYFQDKSYRHCLKQVKNYFKGIEYQIRY